MAFASAITVITVTVVIIAEERGLYCVARSCLNNFNFGYKNFRAFLFKLVAVVIITAVKVVVGIVGFVVPIGNFLQICPRILVFDRN